MTDLRTLTDAFTELERRADGHPVARCTPHADGTVVLQPRAPQHRPRVALVAASAAGVLVVGGIATGLALTGSDGSASGNKAGGSPATSSAPPSSSSAPSTHHFRVPRSSAELARDFTAVLQGRATFTVRDALTSPTGPPTLSTPPTPVTSASGSSPAPSTTSAPPTPSTTPADPTPSSSPASIGAGAYIAGRLDAHGNRGGYDLQINPASRGQRAMCPDPGQLRCTVRSYPDGSSLAFGHETIQGAHGSETFMADFVRTDGAEILMFVSNQDDPKGDSAKLGTNVPLTLTQLSSIVRSTRW